MRYGMSIVSVTSDAYSAKITDVRYAICCYIRPRRLACLSPISFRMLQLHRSNNYLITMGAMASQITSLIIVYSTVYSGADQRKHQSSTSLAFVRAIQRWPVNSPHKWPVPRKMFPFDDVIMCICYWWTIVTSYFGFKGKKIQLLRVS